jgi:hypothetical protein
MSGLMRPRHIPDQSAEELSLRLPTPRHDALPAKLCALPFRLHSTNRNLPKGCGKVAPTLSPRPHCALEFSLQISREKESRRADSDR